MFPVTYAWSARAARGRHELSFHVDALPQVGDTVTVAGRPLTVFAITVTGATAYGTPTYTAELA